MVAKKAAAKKSAAKSAKAEKMMRVEITEERLSDTDPVTERHYLQHKGDIITVPASLGEKWCSLGWAKDVDGNVETGERIPGARTLEAHDVVIKGT